MKYNRAAARNDAIFNLFSALYFGGWLGTTILFYLNGFTIIMSIWLGMVWPVALLLVLFGIL